MIDRIQYEEFEQVKKSDIIALLMDIYKSKESLIMTVNVRLCKATKNGLWEAFAYYNTIKKEISKKNKSEILDNELTPDEVTKYISFDELIAVLEKVKNAIIKRYDNFFLGKATVNKLTKSSLLE